MFKLSSDFSPCGDQPKAIDKLTKAFKSGAHDQVLLGVTGSGKTFTMAHVINNLQKKTLVLAPNKTLAAQLYEEFRSFFPNNAVEYFVSYYDYYQPEAYVVGSDTYIEKDSSINDQIDKLRHSATRSILEEDHVIVVSSVSCIYGIGSPSEYLGQRLNIFEGDKLDRDDFLKALVEIQYSRNDIDFTRGNFRVRGDLVEVFPAYEDAYVIRFEFFDDEVDGIYKVDPLRGKIVSKMNKASIYPKSHYVVGEQRLKEALKSIKLELRETLQKLKKEEKLVEKQRLEQRTLLDIEMLEEMGFCSGIENYSRHLTGAKEGEPPPTLIDYFEKDFLLIVDESHLTVSQVGAMYKGDRSRKENLVNYGFRLPSALDNRPLKFEEFNQRLDQVLYVSATPSDYELKKVGGEYTEQIIRPTGLLDPIIEVRKGETQVDDLLVEAKKIIKNKGRVLITTLTKKLAEDLTSFYKSSGIKIRYLHSDIDTLERMEILRDLRKGEFDVLVGINLLREGLDIPEVELVAILDADKQGFLRSARSLIQTIGRAARNSQGKVLMYAYKISPAMQEAISITETRRKKQDQFNKDNGITPTTIKKEVGIGGIIDSLKKSGKSAKIKKEDISFGNLDAKEIDLRIKQLQKNMKQAVSKLEFEQAANLRDEIKEITQLRMLL